MMKYYFITQPQLNIVEKSFASLGEAVEYEREIGAVLCCNKNLAELKCQNLRKEADWCVIPVFVLRDVNPYFYQCGHYPEYVVEEAFRLPEEVDGKFVFTSWSAAREAADERNARSSASWCAFLNA